MSTKHSREQRDASDAPAAARTDGRLSSRLKFQKRNPQPRINMGTGGSLAEQAPCSVESANFPFLCQPALLSDVLILYQRVLLPEANGS